MQGKDTRAQERLKEIMLADLAYVHDRSIEFLKEQYEDMFPWDWSHHPESMGTFDGVSKPTLKLTFLEGAFRLFGPTQYQQFYCALTRPAARGHMHFIGDTISTIHGYAPSLSSVELRHITDVQKSAGWQGLWKAPSAAYVSYLN